MLYIVLFLHQTATKCSALVFWELLYIVLFLHQTATCLSCFFAEPLLYIVLFLHQTATSWVRCHSFSCCISFYSYIKPQLPDHRQRNLHVVYRSIPTSNRNIESVLKSDLNVVYRSIPTSNRNVWCERYDRIDVVYRSIPTSNRNVFTNSMKEKLLYIVLFLHQTATPYTFPQWLYCCISFYSYIKPQP